MSSVANASRYRKHCRGYFVEIPGVTSKPKCEERALSCRWRAARTAASEGRLEAAASNNPFASGKTDVALAATADEAEAAAEAAAVALLATERFASLLASNFERLGPQAGLKVCTCSSPSKSMMSTGTKLTIQRLMLPQQVISIACHLKQSLG